MTQAVFADYMGVSSKTVEAWECGRTHPTGPANRLLDILQEGKEKELSFVKAVWFEGYTVPFVDKQIRKWYKLLYKSIGVAVPAPLTVRRNAKNTEPTGEVKDGEGDSTVSWKTHSEPALVEGRREYGGRKITPEFWTERQRLPSRLQRLFPVIETLYSKDSLSCLTGSEQLQGVRSQTDGVSAVCVNAARQLPGLRIWSAAFRQICCKTAFRRRTLY